MSHNTPQSARTAQPANPAVSRRAFIGTTALSAVALGAATKAYPAEPPATLAMTEGGNFTYEVTRSDAEWSEMLSDAEYHILRQGATELPKSSPLWDEARAGMYHCKGCDLEAFDAAWKVPLNKGWVFFTHSETNAVLTAIDGPVPQYGNSMTSGDVFFEVHCRRCGSHLGHLLTVERQQVHCINGAALNFIPSTA